MKSISDYAELYREAQTATGPSITLTQVMAGLPNGKAVKDPQLQKALAQAMLKYLTDNGINQNNFSAKTMEFLAKQTGDKDAVALAMAIQQQQDPNAFKDVPVSKPAITTQTVDTNGDGTVTNAEKAALDMANAIAGSWIKQQMQNTTNTGVAAKNVVNAIQRVLADLKIDVPTEGKLLQVIKTNLDQIPNANRSPYWKAVSQDLNTLLAAQQPQQ